MVDEPHHGDGRIEHPDVRFEPTDAPLRWILGAVAASVVLVGVLFAALVAYFHHERSQQNAIKRSPHPLAAAPRTALPPEPRLEQLDTVNGVPSVGVGQRRAAREAILQTYGPTDEKGFVHIPIEQAMKQLAGKLPARKEGAAGSPRANGLVDAGEPNSGRMYRREPRWDGR